MPQDMTEIKKRSGSDNAVVCCNDGYPWGTELRLEDELLSELGIESLAPGDVVEVKGFAFVSQKSEHADKDNSEKSLSLQMTFIKVKREEDDHAKQLYGG